jgi:hypothetical protein
MYPPGTTQSLAMFCCLWHMAPNECHLLITIVQTSAVWITRGEERRGEERRYVNASNVRQCVGL